MDPRRVLPVLTALVCACVVATVAVSLARPGTSRPQTASPQSTTVMSTGPAGILAAWDRRRSAAWAKGDAEALRRLYVDGSRTGAADVRLLGHYLSRGLVVEGMATQLLALEVVARGPSRLVLLVTDRVVGGRAVGGTTPVALPADRASTRRIELVRAGEQWVVAETRDQASAAASTSRTSSSSKS